jgi:hypothetical protein
MLEPDKQQAAIAAQLQPILKFDGCPELFYHHIAGMIIEGATLLAGGTYRADPGLFGGVQAQPGRLFEGVSSDL